MFYIFYLASLGVVLPYVIYKEMLNFHNRRLIKTFKMLLEDEKAIEDEKVKTEILKIKNLFV